MTNCPQCSNPMDMIDGAGLDCLLCALFFDNATLQQWENAQIAINEKEAFEEWQLEQLILELAA